MRAIWKGEDLGDWSGLPTVKEARKVIKMTDINPGQLMTRVLMKDPDAVAALIVILEARRGNAVRIDDVDGEFSDLVWVLDVKETKENADRETKRLFPLVRKLFDDLALDMSDERITTAIHKRLCDEWSNAAENGVSAEDVELFTAVEKACADLGVHIDDDEDARNLMRLGIREAQVEEAAKALGVDNSE